MRFAVFFLIVLTVLAAGHGYMAWRLSAPYEPGSRARKRIRYATLVVVLIIVGSFVVRVAGTDGAAKDVFAWIGYTTMGFSSLLFSLLVIRDLAWLAAKLVARLGGDGMPDIDRRKLLLSSLNIGGVGSAGVLLGYGVMQATTVPSVRRVKVPIIDLPPALDGFRIVQITDLHVGPTIKRAYVEGVVATVNQLEADLVALTGDIVDGSVAYLQQAVAPLGELKSRHGSYIVTGNHEYYSGVDQWLPAFEELNMKVLLNQHHRLDVAGAGLLVAGVTDHRAGKRVPGHRSDPAKAIAGADGDVRLLLAHQPRSIFDAAAAGYHLQISGHTHGGQFFPWNFFAHLGQPYVSGLHLHDGTWIYVSRGAGYWGPPVRVGAPSEISLIELVAA